MLFVSGALGGALIDIYTHGPRLLQDSGVYAVNRSAVYQIINIYGIKMAGVFMMSLGTIWLRTECAPLACDDDLRPCAAAAHRHRI
ncbi:MAG: hypothetical protein R3A10_01435 [Caldilineaceae bacterium]